MRHLLASTLPAITLVAIVCADGPAMAEKVITTTNTKLHVRPGESARVVARVTSGKAMHVLARKGRWIYVRSGSRRGWLTRTTVRDARPKARKTRRKRWGRKAADWGKDSKTPTRTSSVAATTVVPAGSDSGRETAATARGTHATPPPPMRAGIRASAAVGFRSLRMDYVSDGQTGLGDYLVTTSAGSAAIDLEGRIGLGPMQIGAALVYRATYAAPGIHYAPSNGDSAGDIGFVAHHVGATATAGTRLLAAAGGVDVHARLGYRYDAFLVDSVDNVARMPSESWSGVVVGAALELPRLSPSVAATMSYERLASGARAQTDGLSDGTMSELSASWTSVGVDKTLSERIHLRLRYDYQRMRTHWGGPSSRQPDVSWAERKDTGHSFSVGLMSQF